MGAASKVNASNTAAINAAAALSASEYAKRAAQQAATTKDVGTLRDQGFDASSDLRKQDIQEGIDSDNAAFGKTTGIADAATDKTGTAYGADDAANKSAFLQLGASTQAERDRQAKLQGASNGAVDALTPQLGVPAFNGRVQSNAGAAKSLLSATTTAPAQLMAPPDPNATFASELARRLTAGYNRSYSGAAGIADTNAYGTAADEGDRLVKGTQSDLDKNKAISGVSAAALQPEMHAADLRKSNAAESLKAMLDLVQNEKDKNTSRVADTKTKQDAARASTNTALANAITDLYNGKIGANDDFLTAFLNASQNYEGTNNNLTSQKIGGTTATGSFVGSLVKSAITSALTGGINNAMK